MVLDEVVAACDVLLVVRAAVVLDEVVGAGVLLLLVDGADVVLVDATGAGVVLLLVVDAPDVLAKVLEDVGEAVVVLEDISAADVVGNDSMTVVPGIIVRFTQGVQEAQLHVSKVNDNVGADWAIAEFFTVKENVYKLPATVGIEGKSDRDPFPCSHVAFVESPLKVTSTVPDGVCVPPKPEKVMRELVKRGTEVENVIDIVLSIAPGFHVL